MQKQIKLLCVLFMSSIIMGHGVTFGQKSEDLKIVKAGSNAPKFMKDIKEMFLETFFLTYNVKMISTISAGGKSNNVTATTSAVLLVKPETMQKATDRAFEVFKKKAAEYGYSLTDNSPYQSMDLYADAKYPTIAPKIPDLEKNNYACVLTSPTGFVNLASSALMKKMKAYKDKNVIATNINIGFNFIEMSGKKNDFAGTVKTSTSVRIGFEGNMPCEDGFTTPAILGKSACIPNTNFNYYPRASQTALYLKDWVDVPETKAKLVKADSKEGSNTGLSSLASNSSYMANWYKVYYDNEDDFVSDVEVAFTKLMDLYFKAFKAEME